MEERPESYNVRKGEWLCIDNHKGIINLSAGIAVVVGVGKVDAS